MYDDGNRYLARTSAKHLDKAYEFIKQYQEEHIITPTQSHIAEVLGLHQSNVTIILRSLEKEGRIVRGGGNYAINLR